MDSAKILGILAGLIQITAFILYNKGTLKKQNHPNASTWFLWAVLSTLNCVTYFIMSDDFFKSFISIVSSTACVATFFIALKTGRFSKLGKLDYVIGVIGLCAIGVWWAYRSATFGNLILQICLIISFIPIYYGLIKNDGNEKPLPWFLWTIAYSVAMAVVFLRWQGQLQDLAYPFFGILGHGGVGFLSLRKPKKMS
ncbi:hypothetical protein KJ885_00320 [Patescibacteria group bacterium]|nr:hypothetical protein [Patescibacteria group bacterium]